MRIFIAVLVLIFSLQSWTKADDIGDFQIEGMSIGDSLLDYFSEELIEKEKNSPYVFYYKNNKFVDLGIGDGKDFFLKKKLEVYYDVGVTVKPNDKKFKIYAIDGRLFCIDDINICMSKKENIVSELIDFFGEEANHETFESNHAFDKTGNSKTYNTTFFFKSHDDMVRVTVYDWSEKMSDENEYYDNLKVEISSEEFINFMENEAYK